MPVVFEKVQEAKEYIQTKVASKPIFGIICGSGLGDLVNLLENPVAINYTDIPWFAKSTVKYHKGRLVFGKLAGKEAVCMQGRFHPYEGYEAWEISFPVRVMRVLGVEVLMVTCAAGGINPEFAVQDIMVIKDHISFPALGGYSPLVGPNDDNFGVRFPSMQNAYDRDLRDLLKKCADDLGYKNFMREGVLGNVFGPSFEATAEIRMLKVIGVDCVSMSTIPEVITARHAGIKVVGFSLISNKCGLEYDEDLEGPTHQEVVTAAENRSKDLVKLVMKFFESVNIQQ